MILLIFLLLTFALLHGFFIFQFTGLDIHFFLNNFKTPFYRFGISYEPLTSAPSSPVKGKAWMLTFGLIVFNIILIFGKVDDTTAEPTT